MGTKTWAMGVICALLAAGPAMAQSSLPVLGGFTPQQVVNKPIDMTKVVAPFPQPTTNGGGLSGFFRNFTLSKIFPKLLQTSASPRFTTSPFPLPSTFPSTKYPNALPPPTFPKK